MDQELVAFAVGYLAVMSGGFVVVRRLLLNARERQNGGFWFPAAPQLAEARGWPCASLSAEELAALAKVGFYDGRSALSPAALWSAPDARFAALLVRRRGTVHGVVIVTPHGFRRARAPVAELLRAGRRTVAPVRAPPSWRFPDIEAYRMDGRLAVRRAGVETADDLEGLIMAACAILDA